VIVHKTHSAVVYTRQQDSAAAGRELAAKVAEQMEGLPPHALILFVSPRYDAQALVNAVQEGCKPDLLVGCSSAGEFTHESQGEGLACAVALYAPEIQFSASMATGLGSDRAAAARQITRNFRGTSEMDTRYCAAMILTDALAGHADDLLEQLTDFTGGNYQFFGGGAGDDERFQRTQVICGSEISSDAVVALEMVSSKPIGVGVRHGWSPASEAMRVTESEGARLISLNAMLAVDAFREHARATQQEFDPGSPIPFFLHNIIGIDTGSGHKLRVPLAINEDGSVTCAAEVPEGSLVSIMSTDANASRTAAAEATRDALNRIDQNQPAVALFFDCVATRLRLGRQFGHELQAIQEVLGPIDYAGCNTYGQVARADGQFSGFHNCTAVVCVIPA
jgi:hypothetical protein